MKHSKGFTLIELLVVIAIISVLATIILNALGDAQSPAHVMHNVIVTSEPYKQLWRCTIWIMGGIRTQ